jgi:hypothetical protein
MRRPPFRLRIAQVGAVSRRYFVGTEGTIEHTSISKAQCLSTQFFFTEREEVFDAG